MKGTIRILDRDCIGSLFEKINNIVKYTCAAYNLDACIDINENYPILENDEKQTQIVKHALQQEFGNCVFEDKPVMGGEDFGAYLNITSGCYYKIGAKPETNEIVKTNNEPSKTDNKIKESVSSSSKNNIPTQSGKIVNFKNKPINKKTSNENIYYYFLLVILIILLLLAIKCKNKLKEQYG